MTDSTGNPTSNNFKSQFRRLGRPVTSRSITGMQEQGDGADEHTSLLSNGGSGGGKPLYEDDRAWVRYPAAFVHTSWLVLASSYVNILLVFVPAGIICGALGVNPTAVFIVNFLAIVPLAALLSFATEELSVKLGQTIGGLLNATFGNAVELIVRISLLGANGRAMLIAHTGLHCGFATGRNSYRSI
jgi:hypothetical protein